MFPLRQEKKEMSEGRRSLHSDKRNSTDFTNPIAMTIPPQKIESISQLNTLIGQKTLHPLLSIIDLAEATRLDQLSISGDFYALFFKQVQCGDFRFGRRCHDFQSCTLAFKAPGQTIDINRHDAPEQTSILGITFHPKVFNETPLICKKSEYSFFSYQENESLHLSEREKQIILGCMSNFQKELQRDIDRFSLRLLAVHLELLLDYCLRFYERQFITRCNINNDILAYFNQLLEQYLQAEHGAKTELRSIEYVHERIPQSIAYLNDLVRVETGKTLREHVRLKKIDMAKHLVTSSNKTISEIALALGFPNTQTFLCLFKKLVGCSPNEYRQQGNNKPN